MTTLTNERLEELHSYLKACGSLVGMGSAWDELADALCELAALRASQPSEETKATVMEEMKHCGHLAGEKAHRELERMGWK